MNNNPTNIFCHTRRIMIEQIMALIGRGSSDPKQYRRTLESFELATLRRTLAELTEPESRLEISAPPFPDGTSGTDFPALEQYDAHSLDARSQTLVGPTPVREVFSQGNDRQGNISEPTPQLSTPQLLTFPQ